MSAVRTSINLPQLKQKLINSVDSPNPSEIALDILPRDFVHLSRHFSQDAANAAGAAAAAAADEDSLLFPPAVVQETFDNDLSPKAAIARPKVQFAITTQEENMVSQESDDATQLISQPWHEEVLRRSRSGNAIDSSKLPVTNEDTQVSIGEGENGHIDIASSFAQQPNMQEPESLPFSPSQARLTFTQFPESQRFKTPATTSKNRTYNGDVVETPVQGRNPLNNDGRPTPANVFGLSQAFGATQAASSPFANGPMSELRSDRPSPNLYLSRAHPQDDSSPSLQYMVAEKSAVKGPAARYIPVHESQKTSQPAQEGGHDRNEDTQASTHTDFDSIPSVVARQQMLAKREERAREQLRAVSSPISSEKGKDNSPSKHRTLHYKKRRISSHHLENIPSSPPVLAGDAASRHGGDDGETAVGQNSLDLPNGVHSSDHARHSRMVVPETSKRVRHQTRHPPLQPSPSMRNVEPDSVHYSSPIRSSTNLTLTQATAEPVKEVTMFKTIDRVSASPERELDITQLVTRVDMLSEPGTTQSEMAVENNGFGGVDQITSPESTVRTSSVVPETSSNSVRVNESTRTDIHKRDSTVYEKAMLYTQMTTTQKDADWSSQPVRATPPGRKRHFAIVDEEDDDFGTPTQTQASVFDATAILALDADPEIASTLAGSARSSPVMSRKRQKNQFSLDSAQPRVHLAVPEEQVRNISLLKAPVLTKSPKVQVDRNGSASRSTTPIAERNAEEDEEEPEELLPRTVTPKRPARASVWDIEPSPQAVSVPRLGLARSQPLTKLVKPKPQVLIKDIDRKETTQSTRPFHNTAPALSRDNLDLLTTSISEQARSSPMPTDGPVVAPNMIFACYFGKTRAYYPAICLDMTSDRRMYTIEWPGYDAEQVDCFGVAALELRVGDTVKIDAKGFSKTAYIIKAFRVLEAPCVEKNKIMDVHGNTHVVLMPKKHDELAHKKPKEEQLAAVADIYLDSNMWTRIKNRKPLFTRSAQPSNNFGTSTPPVRPSSPSTPVSRQRQSFKESSVQPLNNTGIFACMAFALSIDDAGTRDMVIEQIRQNGGTILRNSFQELFDDDSSMQVRTHLSHLGFTALISDRHSRKEKYMQALALGLPCLSRKWVETSHKTQKLANWQDYLLPAGESAELNGATRSRVLPLRDIHSVKLSDTLQNKPTFFDGEQCVFVSGKGKAEVRRKTHLSLARMMGAKSLEIVNDLAQAESALSKVQHAKSWLLVDDKDFSPAQDLVIRLAARKKKGRKTVEKDMSSCTVVDGESIMQSLIFGRFCSSAEPN